MIEGVFGKGWRYTATSLLESFFKRERLGKSVFIYRLDLGTRENQQGKILFTSFRRHFSTAPRVNEIVTVHRAQSMLLFTFFHAVASKGRHRESDKRHRNPLNARSTSSCRAVTDLDNGLEARFKVKGGGAPSTHYNLLVHAQHPLVPLLRAFLGALCGIFAGGGVPSVPEEKKKRSRCRKNGVSLLIGSNRWLRSSPWLHGDASECDREFEISRLGELC